MHTITISDQLPHPQEYIDLRVEGGLSAKSLKGATIGLKNSLFAVSLWNQRELVGFGRVIGDGGTAYQIVDIVVKPSFQGNGLGKTIMRSLMSYLKANAHPGAYISLIADKPADQLYEQFGFSNVSAHGSIGMYHWFKPDE